MVTIQRYTSTDNGFGGTTETWTDHILDYGDYLDQLSGEEVLAADKKGESSTHVLIGDLADIKRTDRVIYDGMIYDITDVDNPMNMGHHLEITLDYTGESYEV